MKLMLASRDAVVGAILDFLGRGGLLPLDDVRAALEREIDAAGPDALVSLKARLAADDGWTYYPVDPLARRLHHLLADRFLERGSRVEGLDHLDALGAGPLTIFATTCPTPTRTPSTCCSSARAPRGSRR